MPEKDILHTSPNKSNQNTLVKMALTQHNVSLSGINVKFKKQVFTFLWTFDMFSFTDGQT